MSDTATLVCPKCRGQMRSYERNGIQVDQCEDCRGIFLDRGELEQLMQADASAGGDEDSRGPRRLLGHDRGDSRQRRRKNPADLLSELLGGGE